LDWPDAAAQAAPHRRCITFCELYE
jgi:hypothetical protein